MPARPANLDSELSHALVQFGARLRLARLRRHLTAEQVAQGGGITRMTLHRLERGEPAITLGNALKVMSVLGLHGDWHDLARKDEAGHAQADARIGSRRPTTRSTVTVDRYPQLQQLAWNLAPGTRLSADEAFSLYERNWRHLDRDALIPRERALLRRLVRDVGKGVLLV